MSFGAPSGAALSYPVTQAPAQQLATAASEAPQANADAAEKLAQTQAGTETAKLQQQQAQDAQLARIASIPGIERSPMGQKMLTERLKTLGVNVPRDETGGIDMAAVRAIIAPPVKPWSQWSADEVNKEMSLKPELRNLPADAPEAARTGAAIVPVTQAGINSLMKPVEVAESALGKGTGNLAALKGAALSAYKSLAARGADTSVVDGYLNPDHTGLSDEYVNQAAGQLVDAQIDKLHQLGIFQQNETKLRQEAIDEKRREWNNPSANARLNYSLQEKRLASQAAQFNQRLSIMQQGLQARWASISNASQNTALRSSAFGVNLYSRMLNAAGGELSKARGQLTATTSIINQMSQNPKMRASAEYQNLVDQAASLQKFITDNGPQLQSEQDAATQGLAGVYSQITGKPSTVIGTPTGGGPTSTVGGPPAGAQTGTIHTSNGDVQGYMLNGKYFTMDGKPL